MSWCEVSSNTFHYCCLSREHEYHSDDIQYEVNVSLPPSAYSAVIHHTSGESWEIRYVETNKVHF